MIRKACATIAIAAAAGTALLSTGGCASNGPDKATLQAKAIRPPRQPPAVPRAVPTPIDMDLRARARAEINSDLEQSDPILRANAIEALQLSSTADEARVGVLQGLNDASVVVRFAAAMAAGQL